MKTILLLGASLDQIYAIKTAKAMNLNVIVVDMNPNSPGFKFADEYAVISTRDVNKLKNFIDNYQKTKGKINGVMVMGSDIPQIVSEISNYIGTPSISKDAALLATNKFNMKLKLMEDGVPIPWFSKINSIGELEDAITHQDCPLVIKPVDRSGARGVFLIDKKSNIKELFQQSRSFSFSGEIMIEKYLTGIQISTETLMYRGKSYTIGFADRNYDHLEEFLPNIIENGGTVPTTVSYSQRIMVEQLIEKTASSLGIKDGIIKGDVVIHHEKPYLIEIAARLSGGDFSESLIPLGTGVNLVKEAIKLAIGEEPDLNELIPKWNKAVVNRYFFPQPGILEKIEGVEKVRLQPWVKKLEFWYNVGDIVPKITNHADRFGVFVIIGENKQEVEERIKWVYETVKITTKTN